MASSPRRSATASFEIAALEDGVPAFRLVNTHTGGRFRIIKHVLTDHRADVVVQRIRLEVLSGPPLRLFALLAPHLVNGGGAQHRLDRHLQGPPHAVRRGRRHAPRARLLDAVPGMLGRLRRFLRRLADAAAERLADRGVRPRRRWQCRTDRRDRITRDRVPPRPGVWPQRARGRFPRAREPADAVRAPDGGIRHRLAHLAGAASLAGPQGGRAQRLSRQHRGAALP